MLHFQSKTCRICNASGKKNKKSKSDLVGLCSELKLLPQEVDPKSFTKAQLLALLGDNGRSQGQEILKLKDHTLIACAMC